ncbi:hypothetical protein SDRG_15396 [Saprolegnia diclina VS20]|uniref:Uncharacterized protein n=1 Tax=Saprolegnia diclina (strain VS20) TaxID=1156394 RepID=T0PWW1_SAPDV|nr:hypothetical protein SDRG_15396 [Saprolegnia diclina VS20]EQC26746.1 hypothetical protein SDRG_15396 [Saprolegnia diclina VS20]|eukprot:XP_008619789.1 hypothetical protein SDRG_15396 [Saprolegnia diclina VS20]
MAKIAPKRVHLGSSVPPIFELVKSPNISIKLGAERALFAEQGKLLAEYGRHVPSKLKLKLNEDDSDDEGAK